MFELCCTFAHPESHPFTTRFIDHILMCLILLLLFCPTPPPTQTSLPSTRTRMHPSAPPRGGMLFGSLVEQRPLASHEPRICTEVSIEHTPINLSSRRNSFNTDYNDLTTTIASSETTDTKEVGQLTSPLFYQEREVSAGRFGVSDAQQQAVASSSNHHHRM